MSNEVIFFSIVAVDLAFVYLASRLGIFVLASTIPINLLITNFISGKLISVFELTTTIGNATFIGIYFATDILTELKRKELAKTSVNAGLLALLLLYIVGILVGIAQSVPNSESVSKALDVAFSSSNRIVIASAVAYFISSNVNLYLYSELRSNNRSLVISNALAAYSAYLVDQVVFVGIAFLGSQSMSVFLELLLTGIVIKTFCASLEAATFWRVFSVKTLLRIKE
ncbi:MAG: queuosine precursor transporter [Candidatus Accumulibacter sp.]|uniref:Queuosine precursor transporter n=1 Tax=Candidatus Accumulibacter proximus TaxID=2954385 RepID=A0A935UGL4_9PROT|nr:queuosine precursor transporter [Candidatus Accumulibacter proximus]